MDHCYITRSLNPWHNAWQCGHLMGVTLNGTFHMWNSWNYSHSWGSSALFPPHTQITSICSNYIVPGFFKPQVHTVRRLPSRYAVVQWKEWFSDLHFQDNFYFYYFYWRQRYVDLLERIPQQMKALYKKMMAQQLVDRHITEELLYFKECVAQLARSESFLILKNYLHALSLAYWFCSVFKSSFHRSRQLFFLFEPELQGLRFSLLTPLVCFYCQLCSMEAQNKG